MPMKPICPRHIRHAPVFLSLILLIMVISGCRSEAPPPQQTVQSPAPAKPPRPWLVLCANPADALELRKIGSMQKDTVWQGRSISGGWIVEPIIVATTGTGIANAVATAQHLIDHYDPVAIIVTGLCTPVNPVHQPGDLVIPNRWVNFDFGRWGAEGLLPDSIPIGRTDSVGFERHFDLPVDTALARMLRRAAETVAFRMRTIDRRMPELHLGGVGLSGNAVVTSKARREQLRKQLGAEISDTESAALVQTARSAGLPIIVLRACAPPVDQSDDPVIQKMLPGLVRDCGRNTALIVSTMLENVPEGFLRGAK
ncbi:MAG: 5'-methylthioadenosine/S-adenosylhomocysteine nucleosidase [Candidatus Zixiibacteriota bacterium]